LARRRRRRQRPQTAGEMAAASMGAGGVHEIKGFSTLCATAPCLPKRISAK
jgi:hypothetical protein